MANVRAELEALPSNGKEWEDLPPNKQPMFWTTPVAFGGVRYRVAQLIFRTNEDAEQYVRRRAQNDPGVLQILRAQPAIEVTLTRPKIKMDHEKQPGFIAALIANGYFERPVTAATVVSELKRRGRAVHHTNVYRDLNRLAEQGFLTIEPDGYQAVPDMKVRIVERDT